MFDRDTLELIQTTAVDASGVRATLPPSGTEPPNVYYIHTPGGPQRVEGEIPPKHVAGDIDTVVRLAKAVEGSAVWYDRTGVVAHHPDGDRATFKLAPSKLFQQLIDWDKLAAGHGCDQPAAYKLIRTKLRDALGVNYVATLAAVKEVRVRMEQKTDGAIDRQRTSMGRSVVAESTGPEVPDVLVLYVPVFESAAAHVCGVVKVAFDLDPQSGQFSLVVLPGEVEQAWGRGESYLLERIEKAKAANGCEDLPVYYGQPG